ncbi:Hypothetical predicted protein [Olea europaea subsp. europaea]|uniref:Uncharacterized protein n=1 Tax=Olea europaea subsp. europaea TaxID=158383 RepID=A0A8S0S2E3_OLEEU|nr:Hypothetical predicted protein [Olea europaea subsp. europaea]
MVCRPFLGRIRATTGTKPDFSAFEGSFWVRTWCAGNVQDATGRQPDFYDILGHVLAGAGMQPYFQAFLGSFWVTVSKPSLRCIRQCSGLVEAAVGLQHDFQVLLGKQFLGHGIQAMSWMRQGRSQIFWQFLGHDVQAMTRTRSAHDRDAT